MTNQLWNLEVATNVISRLLEEPGPVLIALQSIQAEFGYVDEQAIDLIANTFNVTRAEVFGVFTFYHDLKTQPIKTVKICAAEACQALGAEALIAEAKQDGLEVEKIFCFGNCALAPAAMKEDRLIGRATLEKLK